MFEDYIKKIDKKRKKDAETFKSHHPDKCMLCNAEGPDKRSLFISCFYSIDEVVPEALDLTDVEGQRGYYLRICKACRGALLDRLNDWRNERIHLRDIPKDSDGDLDAFAEADGIPVRVNGRTVWMTKEEYERHRKGE